MFNTHSGWGTGDLRRIGGLQVKTSNQTREGDLSHNKTKWRARHVGFAAVLMLSCSPVALHAETSNDELASEIKALKAQIRELKSAVAETRVETRRTSAKVKAVASHGYEPPPPGFAVPQGATPLFVTADKKIQFGAITITPGGYFAGESVYRSKATGSDIGTQFGAIPFKNSPLGNVGEFRPSARSTRLALLAEGAISQSMIAGGYAEIDFFSSTQTANYNQTNSYNPRIRHLYMTLDSSEYGLHVLAGQSYSLVTLNTKGITPRNELTPVVIDNNQTVGSIYARQPQIRLVKDFNQKLWLAVSAEASQTTNGCGSAAGLSGPNGAVGTNALTGIATADGSALGAYCNYTGAGGNANTLNQSFNHIPDVVAKAAYEAKIADRDVHLEAFGLYTDLYDRVQTTALGATVPTFANYDTTGYGVGGGIVAAVIPKRLDVQVNGMYGRGIGRYGPTGITESTFNPNGSEKALPEVIGLVGVTFHATPSIDIYGYAGVESAVRSYADFTGTPTYVGVGAPNIDNTGCNLTSAAAATAAGVTGGCTGSNKLAYELTIGMWDKIYKGSFGEVRGGLQYAYVQRQLFNAPGLGTTKTDENMVFTSLRYYPFQ